MGKDTMTIGGTDGRSRVFDAEGKLLSIDGVPVEKPKAPEVESKKQKQSKAEVTGDAN